MCYRPAKRPLRTQVVLFGHTGLSLNSQHSLIPLSGSLRNGFLYIGHLSGIPGSVPFSYFWRPTILAHRCFCPRSVSCSPCPSWVGSYPCGFGSSPQHLPPWAFLGPFPCFRGAFIACGRPSSYTEVQAYRYVSVSCFVLFGSRLKGGGGNNCLSLAI